MKITKTQLKRIIKEVIKEDFDQSPPQTAYDMGPAWHADDTTTEGKILIVIGEIDVIQERLEEKAPDASHKLQYLMGALQTIHNELRNGVT